MRSEIQVLRGESGEWTVLRQTGGPVTGFRRLCVAEAYGRALAHRARIALVVHHHRDRSVRFSGRELTYACSL
jgi:hypothetical protein